MGDKAGQPYRLGADPHVVLRMVAAMTAGNGWPPISWRHSHRLVPVDSAGQALFDSALAPPWKPPIVNHWSSDESASLLADDELVILKEIHQFFPNHDIDGPSFPSLARRIDNVADRWAAAVYDRRSVLIVEQSYRRCQAILSHLEAAGRGAELLHQTYRGRRELSPFAAGSVEIAGGLGARIN